MQSRVVGRRELYGVRDLREHKEACFHAQRKVSCKLSRQEAGVAPVEFTATSPKANKLAR